MCSLGDCNLTHRTGPGDQWPQAATAQRPACPGPQLTALTSACMNGAVIEWLRDTVPCASRLLSAFRTSAARHSGGTCPGTASRRGEGGATGLLGGHACAAGCGDRSRGRNKVPGDRRQRGGGRKHLLQFHALFTRRACCRRRHSYHRREAHGSALCCKTTRNLLALDIPSQHLRRRRSTGGHVLHLSGAREATARPGMRDEPGPPIVSAGAADWPVRSALGSHRAPLPRSLQYEDFHDSASVLVGR